MTDGERDGAPAKTAMPASGSSAPLKSSGSLWNKAARAEDAITTGFFLVMACLPAFEVILRPTGIRVPGAVQFVSVLTLWIGFSGGLLATRDDRHLSLSTGVGLLKGRARRWATRFAALVTGQVTLVLAYGSWVTLQAERFSTEVLPFGIPVWVPQVAMPFGYGLIAFRLVWVKFEGRALRLLAYAFLLGFSLWLYFSEPELGEAVLWPFLGIILAATLLGAPMYVALGGAALALFWAAEEPIAAVAAETVRQLKAPTMPTIPLFTLAGYVLAEAGASQRLVRVFRALFGWLPGGTAIMTALVCAFFATFTGASGVTILALGGLLYPILLKEAYDEDFSLGLLTASGSIGLLFPPSLPVILYGVVAHVPIDQMFIAGILPGCVLVAAVSFLGVRAGLKIDKPRVPFRWSDAQTAVWEAKWELFLPILVMGGIFLGLTTLVEAAALTAIYALFIEGVIHRELSWQKLGHVGKECGTLIGGLLIILGVALGFTAYQVDAEVPERVLEWVQGTVHSKYVFLIVLNLLLLVVGCVMDIFSAILVVVPLILPIGKHFGIDPIHLGIIFLANLELGFLTPPVGMNLFLSAYRFDRPLTRVYRVALPFLVVLIVAVLLITYVPWLTLGPVQWVFGDLPEPPAIEF